MPTLAPSDAIRHWLSRRARNDLFLLYCFDEPGCTPDTLRATLLARCAAVADLRIRLREYRFAYPRWVPCGIAAEQIAEHPLPQSDWTSVGAALSDLLADGVAAERQAWRLHLFRHVTGAPGGDGPALVVVLQLSHALADGRRAAEIARAVFGSADTGSDDGSVVEDRSAASEVGSPDTVPTGAGVGRRRLDVRRSATGFGGTWFGRASAVVAVRGRDLAGWAIEGRALAALPVGVARTVVRGIAAERARRELAERTARGEIPPPGGEFAPTVLNRPPAPARHAVRMLVRADLRVPGRTVTALVLAAIAEALPAYLAGRGEAPGELAAQVSVALPASNALQRNNYRDVAVELHCDENDPHRRTELIAATLAARRIRAAHPLLRAPDRATAALPAPVLRRDIAAFPLGTVPAKLSAHTVVSSVHRGAADLTCAGAPVRFTAGFPALGAVMHLTHGVHGLGDTITVSLHADPDALPDLDDYAAALDTALTRVVALAAAPRDPYHSRTGG
ncbi:WS/DGAT domain-containing protein [Nocardia aurantia]|nr:WS/DGAT domain-containing protein [Nocardia aurantia]